MASIRISKLFPILNRNATLFFTSFRVEWQEDKEFTCNLSSKALTSTQNSSGSNWPPNLLSPQTVIHPPPIHSTRNNPGIHTVQTFIISRETYSFTRKLFELNNVLHVIQVEKKLKVIGQVALKRVKLKLLTVCISIAYLQPSSCRCTSRRRSSPSCAGTVSAFI